MTQRVCDDVRGQASLCRQGGMQAAQAVDADLRDLRLFA